MRGRGFNRKGNVLSCVLSASVGVGFLLSPQVSPAAFGGYLPLRASGSVSYAYGYVQSGGTESESTSLIGTINATGYVWQPWFATTSAALNLGFSNTETTTTSTDGSVASGTFSLDVFPRSRFPFSLTYSVTDNKTENFSDITQASGSVETRTKRLSLRQSYRGRRGSQVSGWYSLTNFESESVDSDNTNYGLTMQGHREAHQVTATASHSESETSNSEAKPKTGVFSATHIYTPSSDLGVTSIVSYVDTDSGLGLVSGGRKSNIAQGTSSFFWRPEHRDFSISGGVRLSEVETNAADGDTQQRSLSTNIGANYRVTRAIRMGAAATVSSSESDGVQTVSSSQSANVSYVSPNYEVLGFGYNWQTGVNTSNSSVRTDSGPGDSSTTDTQSTGASFGHNASTTWHVGRTGSVGLSLGQSISGNKNSNEDQIAKNINHSAGLSGSHRGSAGSTYGSLRVYDSRSKGVISTKFQQFSATLTQDAGLSPLSSLSVNAAYQASRNEQEDELGDTNSRLERSLSGTASYHHDRPFGIYNLRFFSRFIASKQIDSPTPSSLRDWDSRLNYSLGLLDTSLSFRIIESAGGTRTKSLYFRATRSF
jgi:hypothetical protein